MRADHLLRHVIEPTLAVMAKTDPRLQSKAAAMLLLGTACHESQCGLYLVQMGGPALGIYQVEPATHEDMWNSFLAYRPDLAAMMREIGGQGGHDRLIWNLRYATAVARMVYWRAPEKLPDEQDVPAMAEYWKDHYNTHKGEGTPEKYMADWRRHTAGVIDASL